MHAYKQSAHPVKIGKYLIKKKKKKRDNLDGPEMSSLLGKTMAYITVHTHSPSDFIMTKLTSFLPLNIVLVFMFTLVSNWLKSMTPGHEMSTCF